PTSRRVAAGALGLWNLTTRHKELSIQVGVIRYGIAFTRDGRRIVSCGPDMAVRLHDSTTGSELLTLVASRSRPSHCVAFSLDAFRLACGAEDNLIYLWDAHPPNSDARVEREAVSLIRALGGQAKNQTELRNKIIADFTTTNAVHRLALQLLADE